MRNDKKCFAQAQPFRVGIAKLVDEAAVCVNYFSYIRANRLVAATDGGVMPANETLAEHREHCEAESPSTCPFEREAMKVDEADLISQRECGQSNAANSSKPALTFRHGFATIGGATNGKYVGLHKDQIAAKLKWRDIAEREAGKPIIKTGVTLDLSHRIKLEKENLWPLPRFRDEHENVPSMAAATYFIPYSSQFPIVESGMKQILCIASLYMKRYKGYHQKTETGDEIHIDKMFAEEFAGSKYAATLRKRNLKTALNRIRLMPAILPLIRHARNPRMEEEAHEHKGPRRRYFANGVTRYDSDVAIEQPDGGIRTYTVTLVVANHENGKKYLYDVVNLRPLGTPEIVRRPSSEEPKAGDALDEWLASC